MSFRSPAVLLVLVAGVYACAEAAPEASPLYFSSPETAVTRCTELLRAKQWPELARYYDLTGTGVARGDLERGDFFLRTDPPANADPAGLAKFREPFAPGYKFVSATLPDGAGVVTVTVAIAIDEGGGLIQRGRTTFRLRKSSVGYQLLPSARPEPSPAFAGDPAYAATGGISRAEAAEKLGVELESGSWHAVYSPALMTWFFSTPQGPARALERVALVNPTLPQKAPPGFEPKPWRWTARALPKMDVIAPDELARGTDGATRFHALPAGFDDLASTSGDSDGEVDVPREHIWALLDRARERHLRVRVSVDTPARPGAHAALSLAPQ